VNEEKDSVKSPCNNVCKLDENGLYCISCYRTIDEIQDWSQYGNEEKSKVLDRCEIRKNKDISSIPKGVYCYTPIKFHEDGHLDIEICPYWGSNSNKDTQESGFCILIGEYDWSEDSGFGLLWDQCKSCNINKDF